jgi:hypothetical protein
MGGSFVDCCWGTAIVAHWASRPHYQHLKEVSMDEPIINIETITRDAHQAAEAGQAECPYPDHWEAAGHWRQAHHARAKELTEEATT